MVTKSLILCLACLLLLSNHMALFKLFSDNPSFKKWLGDAIFTETYQQG